jgi:ketosteroid isomerase-like protein
MSRENVELARQSYDAFNRRDLDAFLALMDDQVQTESRLVAVEGGYHGHEGVRRWWNDFLGAFPDYRIEVEEIRDLGELTLSRFLARAHAAASNTPLTDRVWQPIRWRHGKCVWWTVCPTEAEALEAVGLTE